jgi:hypothetical protein
MGCVADQQVEVRFSSETNHATLSVVPPNDSSVLPPSGEVTICHVFRPRQS